MTDSFKKTADDYKPAGGRGAFKNRSVGASDVLREMQRQVNPIINAHKRNADAIFATQLRYLSDVERAQSEEEQSRKVAHKFEMDKMDNVQKWNKDAISKLQEYKTGGYQEIMSKAIKMSEFSQWASTLIDVGTQVAKLGVQVAADNQAKTAQETDLFGPNSGSTSDQAKLDQDGIDQGVSVDKTAEELKKNDLKTQTKTGPKGGELNNNKENNTAFVNSAGSPTTAWKKNQNSTKASFDAIANDAATRFEEALENNRQLKGGEQKTHQEMLRESFAQAADSAGLRGNFSPAARKLKGKLIEARDRLLNQYSDANFKAALGKGHELMMQGVDNATTVEELQDEIDYATATGSPVINPKTKVGYTSADPGRRGDLYIEVYDRLIRLGKYDLAEKFAFHMQPQDYKGKPSGHKSHFDQNKAFQAHVISKTQENKTAQANAQAVKRNVEGKQKYKKLLNFEEKGEGSLNEALLAAQNGNDELLQTWGVNALKELKGYPDQETQLRFFLTENSTNSNYNDSFWEDAQRYAENGQLVELNKMLPNVPQKHKHAFVTKYINQVRIFKGQFDYNSKAKERLSYHQAKLKPNGTTWSSGEIVTLRKAVDKDMRFIVAEARNLIGQGVDPRTALDSAENKLNGIITSGKDDITSDYYIISGSDNPNGNHAEYGNLHHDITAFGGKLPSQIINKLRQYSNPRAVLADTKNSIGLDTLFDTRTVAEQWKLLVDSNGQAAIHLSPEQEMVFREVNKGLPTGKKMKESEFHALILKNQGYPIDELPVDKWDIVIMGNINTTGYAEFENKVLNGVVPSHLTMSAMAYARQVRDNPNEANVSLGVNPVALKKYKVKNQAVNPFDQNPYGPFRGEWKPNTRVSRTDKPYKVGDVVSHGGQQYVSRATHSSHNINPSEDTENWRLKEDTTTVDNFDYLESITGVELQFTPKNLRNMPGIDRGDKFWIKGSTKLRDFNSQEVNFGTVLDLDYTLDEDSLFLKER